MKTLLGDNQFFGVNHADLEKAKATQALFGTAEKIESFIQNSLDLGIDGYMINSNDVGYQVVKNFDFKNRSDKECHYSIPYPHKYASMVNESGMMSLLKFVLRRIKFSDIGNTLKFLFTSNVTHLISTIVRLEVPKNLPKGSVIYFQNVVADLALGLENGSKVIAAYIRAVEKMGYKAGLITLNPEYVKNRLVSEFKDHELYLCFNINKTGFNVFPSLERVEQQISYLKSNTNWKLVGMSIFSSGKSGVSIEESINYVKGLPLDYVVFGTSKLKNLSSNIRLFRNENS